MIPEILDVHQLVWHLEYIDTAVEDNELYCYNIAGDRNSVVSQVSCRMAWILRELQTETVILKKDHP